MKTHEKNPEVGKVLELPIRYETQLAIDGGEEQVPVYPRRVPELTPEQQQAADRRIDELDQQLTGLYAEYSPTLRGHVMRNVRFDDSASAHCDVPRLRAV